jgi:hypothetical protein
VAFIAGAAKANLIAPALSPALKGVPEITPGDLVNERRNAFTGRVSAFCVANDRGDLVLPGEQARIIRNGCFLPEHGQRLCSCTFVS